MTADLELLSDTGEGRALARLCERVLGDFIADPARNNMGPGRTDPAWEGVLLGFGAGDDPLWDELKSVVGPQHWTPAEAFVAAARGDAAATRALPRSSELTVVSWAICQTEAAKAANRLEMRVPSELWVRSRIYGQQANVALHQVMVTALLETGHEAIAPSLLPAWVESDPHTNGWRSTWSERHVAYVAGLGTFGLTGGLITRRGQAVRLGSVVVNAVIPATPRPYSSPFAYCLHFSGGGCAECADRCPTGSVSVEGRDKEACASHLSRTGEYVKRVYGFDGYGCGLCQTGVPCESGIPEELVPPAARS